MRCAIWYHLYNLKNVKNIHGRAYSRTLLGATFAPNLVPWVLEKIFSLEKVKNNFCFGNASKQNALFSENVP